jgi:tripartite-type tricarboxylate transporter receptor subunit TctC
MKNYRLPTLCSAILVSLSTVGLTAAADTYPDKPIRMVVISAPGGTTDIISRALAQQMSIGLGQQVVTDNRPGAGGIIAAEITAHSPPDGYTVYYTHTAHSVLPSLHDKLPYDPIKDFSMISLIAVFPGVLVVNNAVPAQTVKDLIAMAKAQPGKLNYATGTTGATAHLAGELFKKMAGVSIAQVPYKGTAGQITSVIAGETQFTFASLPAILPHVRGGRVRALAVGSARRVAVLPNVPTVAEAALPGFDVSAWNGVIAPKDVPRPIIDRLNQEMRKAAASPSMRERAAGEGAELVTDTPEEFTRFIQSEMVKWAPLVKNTNMKAN